jgi:fatty acid desaturase
MASNKSSGEPGGCVTFIVVVFLIWMLVLAVVWFVSAAGHVLHLTPTYPEMDKRSHAWIAARYENVTWGYVLTVLTLVVGVPLSIALTAHLAGPGPRARDAAAMAVPLIALVVLVAFAHAGPR